MNCEEYEEICPECKGKINVKVVTSGRTYCSITKNGSFCWRSCPVCYGHGTIDWVDKIKGKRKFPEGKYRIFEKGKDQWLTYNTWTNKWPPKIEWRNEK